LVVGALAKLLMPAGIRAASSITIVLGIAGAFLAATSARRRASTGGTVGRIHRLDHRSHALLLAYGW
jgi:uncharacterized membrane protein YeaQ/YmgE (transglycosylase-associated protein family)